MAGSSPQGPWVPLTSGPERPRHRNPRPPSPPATHTWPTFAGDNRDSHPNWWKQARKAGSGPPGPGSHIGRPGVRSCRALPRNRALLSLASAAEARRQQAPFSMRPSEKTRPPAVAALASRAARSPAALLFAARHVPLPGGQHRPGRGRSAPSRGAAAPPSARPRDCSAASRPAAVSLFHAPSSRLTRRSWPGSIGFI